MIRAWRETWPEWWITALLAGLALVFWTAPVPRLKDSVGGLSRPVSIADLPPVPASPDVSALLARPLFSTSRRPEPAATAPAPTDTQDAPPSPSGINLLGVYRVGEQAEALISLAGQSRPQLAALGATVGDWVVTKITGDSVTLQSGQTSAELDLPAPAAPSNPSNGLPPGFPPQPQPLNRGN